MQAKKIALFILLTLLVMPTAANAQWSIKGVNVYAIHQSLGLGLGGMDYNETSHVFRLKMHYVPNRTATNIGLGLLEVIFAFDSHPTAINAYMIINNETLQVQDQLVNATIRSVDWEMPNGTIVNAHYAYAYFYLFENQSVTNPAPMTPFYQDLSIIPHESSVVLAENSVPASDFVGKDVYCDYDFGQEGTDLPVVLVAVGVVAFILVLVVVWTRKR